MLLVSHLAGHFHLPYDIIFKFLSQGILGSYIYLVPPMPDYLYPR